MPFNGQPDDFIPYARENLEDLQNQLSVWALEWLEMNCVSWRWFTPTRRTLGEIFGVATDHSAADVAKAYEHFDANPGDRNVADVRVPGERGEVKFSILRTPHADIYESYWGRHVGSFWTWFTYRLRQFADRLDARMIGILRSVANKVQHTDLSTGARVDQLRDLSIMLSRRAGWLIHETAAVRIEGDLTAAGLGAPLTTITPSSRSERGDLKAPYSEFSPATCILRDEALGYHYVVADSTRVTVRVINDDSADLGFDVWTGFGLDTTTGRVKAMTFDLGVREGI